MQKEDFIVKTWPFLLVAIIYVITGISMHNYFGQDALHLKLNQYHAPWADFFFRYFTKTGELFFGLLILLWLIYKNNWRWVLFFVSSAIVQSIIILGLKRGFFIDHLRPAYYFKEKGIELYLVEGVQQSITFTYPSGHTSTAFFVFLFMALLTPKRWLQAVLGLCAVFAGLSRIYLSQHFMLDTAVGALIGVVSVILSYYIIRELKMPQLDRKILNR